MSFSGGVFSINTAGQPVVAGTSITDTAFNLLTADLATGLSTCVLKDGTQTTTAVVPFAAGISLGGGTSLTTYVSSTWTATHTGCTTSPTTTIYYTKIGNAVTLSMIADNAGTSNNSTHTLTGLPAAITPTSSVVATPATVGDNGGTPVLGRVIVSSGGFLGIGATVSGASWTTSGTATIYAFSVSYTLN
jgi:hypothetical protein